MEPVPLLYHVMAGTGDYEMKYSAFIPLLRSEAGTTALGTRIYELLLHSRQRYSGILWIIHYVNLSNMGYFGLLETTLGHYYYKVDY